MAERDWVRPGLPLEDALGMQGGAASLPGTRFELRPLSLGEILDRAFSLYRSRFLLFAGIAMVAAAINAAGQAVSLTAASHLVRVAALPSPNATPAAAWSNLRMIVSAQAGTYLVMLVFFLVSALTQAATALAVARTYESKPVTAGTALLEVAPRWYRWIAIALWQACSFLCVPVGASAVAGLLLLVGIRSNSYGVSAISGVLLALALLAGFPLGIMLYLRNALALPAAAMEGLSVQQAMRRSKLLAGGTKGRILVVLLIAFCLLEVVGVLQTPAAFLILLAPGKSHYIARGISLLIAFVGHTVVAPLALIGLTLVYFDQRVRKEGLDLEWMLADARRPEMHAPPA